MGFSLSRRPGVNFIMLCLLLAALWFAGGASRGNVSAQIIVRAAAFGALIAMIVFGQRPGLASARAVWIFMGAALAIAVIQLLPLPEDLWRSLPARDIVAEVPVAGATRTWSQMPGGTLNALIGLVVPLVVLALTSALAKNESEWLPTVCLGLAAASMVLGVMQFSGAGFDNPLLNDTPGSVSGMFANRNHYALLLALGCLLVPVWIFREHRPMRWRGGAGLSLMLLFALTILASGSRVGMVVGALAVGIAGILSWPELRRELRQAPRWVFPAIVVAVPALLISAILASVAADRAVSIQRVLSLDAGQDLRGRVLPIIWDMTRANFPAGTGLGTFDQMFRASEPLDLLKPTYLNQAHNDFLEVVLDAGLPGLLLLSAALVWWGWATGRAWRAPMNRETMLPRVGSAMLLLVMIASVFDYPARTPLIMAMVVIAAVWLSAHPDKDRSSALPGSRQLL
ncbi:O-antigen ligase family protein [Sphingomonas sp. MG17]|uniref:O-antigen ligase family protein n=1 Tax=Sphingomonas tagetis TaxID=2949092 RepID=A0A9X2KMR3_9SPHN|nr:O-antigen ligase family protein [Sphingomonas tagetis]MCP3732909.1 O-antigen ligase family protein [Sphingomonas tagetis]